MGIFFCPTSFHPTPAMAPMKKAMKGGKVSKAMTKTQMAEALATETELKKSECLKVITGLADIAAKQVKRAGTFTLPAVCMIKTRLKPATKARKREMFGK